VNELFGDLLPAYDMPAIAGTPLKTNWFPRIDMVEGERDLLVTAELPGLSDKDVEISLVGDLLTIKGEKKFELDEKGRVFHRSERSYGSFQRVFELPCDVDRKSIKAVFEKGVLKVSLPKIESAQRSVCRIEVKPGN